MVKLPVYMDYNATTPCDPRVVEAMTPYFTRHFGNAASRTHAFGWEAEEAVELSRERIAGLIGAEPKEIVFTSGATEADNLAIKGVFELYASKGNLPTGQAGHIITCATEHKAVLDTCKHIEKNGAEITYLKVNADGIIDLNELESAIRPTTILIAIMYANNEIGTIQPIREIGAIAKKKNVLFFSDATQAVGKISVNVVEDGIDIMALSSHKMYGPKGVGALYVRRKNPRVKLAAQMDGGGHERGFRSGTLNVPGIVGFGKAAEIAADEMKTDYNRLSILRDRLEKAISNIDEIKVNGSIGHRNPNVTNISFRYVDAGALISGLNKTIAVSTGSACSSASMEASYVLKALGLEDDLALSSLRFSLGKYSTEEEVDYVVEKVTNTVNELRALISK
jgi:cysteine desulfurase